MRAAATALRLPRPISAAAILACFSWALSASAADAADAPITFYRDIAPIFNAKCLNCHRVGLSAPMSLATYEETRPWIKSIRQTLQSGTMPPWRAEPPGVWQNDLSLSPEARAKILAWIDAGAPRGEGSEPAAAPAAPDQWRSGPPDYVVTLGEVAVPAQRKDFFVDLPVKIDLAADRWVQGVEVRPGNRRLLHHLMLYQGSSSMAGKLIASWAVGGPPVRYPDGVGFYMPGKTELVANMHYHPDEVAGADKTEIGFYFGKGPLNKVVTMGSVSEPRIKIPPGAPDYVLRSVFEAPQAIDIISFLPHMHARGVSAKYELIRPGAPPQLLLSVSPYVARWQWFYYPIKPIRLAKGDRLAFEAHFNNSPSNADNPDPAQLVVFGNDAAQEMMIGNFEYIPVEGVVPAEPTREEMFRMVDRFLSENRSPDIYGSVLWNAGAQTPMAWILPRQGDAFWVMPNPGQMTYFPLSDVRWNGQEFTCKITAVLQFEQSLIRGRVGEDGSIEGSFTGYGVPAPDGTKQNIEFRFRGKRKG